MSTPVPAPRPLPSIDPQQLKVPAQKLVPSSVCPSSLLPNTELTTFATAASHWHNFGLQVIPLIPVTKQTAVKWDNWLSALSAEKITDYWSQHPDHELGFIVGDEIIVFDADSEESIVALKNIEESHGVFPNMVVRTRKGEHHYFRRAKGTFAKTDSHCTEKYPHRIDIKTDRAMVVLAPSTGKSVSICTAKNSADLVAVDQCFIDSVYLHNDRTPPRPVKAPTLEYDHHEPSSESIAKVQRLLDHIDPDIGYEDWLHVLMAIYHESGGSDEGLAIADRWSSTGKKYEGIRDLTTKWNSFRAYAGKSFTIGTLIHMTQKKGGELQNILEPFEVVEVNEADTAEVSCPEAVPEETGTILDRFSLRGMAEQLEKAAVEQIPILGKVALQGQATCWYAAPNSGKTLLALKLLLEGIEAGRINPQKAYYLNMDDTSKGLAEKVRIAEEYGFHMLAEGHQGFTAKMFIHTVEELINKNQANGVVIILDTLKKFTDLMKKDQTSDFNAIVRNFVSKGGTLIALAHTNKNRDKSGRAVPCGTSDVIDDFDCAYVIDTVTRTNMDEKIIEFSNRKSRGYVVESAAYSYIFDSGISYLERLLSVHVVDMEKLAPIKKAEQIRTDQEVIDVVISCIRDGIDSKMKLAVAVSERASVSRKKVLEIIEKYTGDDPTLHRWTYNRGAHGKQVYVVLEQPPGDDTMKCTQI